MVLVLVLPDSFLSSSRYDEGKMLKGTGTLASKSRLTALYGRAESSSSQPLDKEEKKSPLASSWGKKSKERRIREGPYQLIRTPSVLWGFDRATFFLAEEEGGCGGQRPSTTSQVADCEDEEDSRIVSGCVSGGQQ